MNVSIHINGYLVESIEVDGMNAINTANQYESIYRAEVLRRCNVPVDISINGLVSKMSDKNFILKREWYDDGHFAETVL